jgi:Cellulose binding domain/Bacterial Ig domain
MHLCGARMWARAALGLALLAAPVLVGGTPASAQATSCVVEYDSFYVSATQFYAQVSIGNLGPDISEWTLRYTYPGNQSSPSATRGGTWSQSGQNVTVTGDSDIPPWQTARASALFSYSGTNSAPTAFTVNGTPCGVAFGCTEVGAFGTMTAPAQGQVFSHGSAITLSANLYAGCPVRAVTFFATNTSTNAVTTIGTLVVTGGTPRPYTVTWQDAPPGSYRVWADGYAPPGNTAVAPSVGITVTP